MTDQQLGRRLRRGACVTIEVAPVAGDAARIVLRDLSTGEALAGTTVPSVLYENELTSACSKVIADAVAMGLL